MPKIQSKARKRVLAAIEYLEDPGKENGTAAAFNRNYGALRETLRNGSEANRKLVESFMRRNFAPTVSSFRRNIAAGLMQADTNIRLGSPAIE
ncbi:MAG: hypothetical protein KGH94_02095 [Candidatus Micrarchaeota archaeon]|nr:hypothetical protein [Candidatus Micrarchaeota archaeon]